jgi:glutamate dehydrogenase (NAD(P)+)
LVPGLESLEGAQVAVQGFGNAGSAAARLFREEGAVIRAVSDSRGGILSDAGIDPEAAAAFKREHGTVVGLPGTRTITNEELLALECDILVPAALENQIRRDNAPNVRARLISEAANGPTTPAADERLCRAGVIVLPDILANAGGVTVSYYEWVQNIENEQWELETVNRKLRSKMVRAVDTVVDTWKDLQARGQETPKDAGDGAGGASPPEGLPCRDLRTAAMLVAIGRLSHVALERGIWP